MLNEVPQMLLQLPFFRTRIEYGAHALDKEKADQQGKKGCKQDGDFVHVFSPFVVEIKFEIQEMVLARLGMITRSSNTGSQFKPCVPWAGFGKHWTDYCPRCLNDNFLTPFMAVRIFSYFFVTLDLFLSAPTRYAIYFQVDFTGFLPDAWSEADLSYALKLGIH